MRYVDQDGHPLTGTGEWKHVEEWDIQYEAWVQTFYRAEYREGVRHLWRYFRLTDDRWDDLDAEVKNFYLMDRDHGWDHREDDDSPWKDVSFTTQEDPQFEESMNDNDNVDTDVVPE